VGQVLRGLDLCDAHDVAHRHDPDEALGADDGNVAVAVLGQAGEGSGGVDVGSHAIGVGGHPRGDGVAGGIGAARREAYEVPLSEDADRASRVDDHHRAHALLTHTACRGGDGLVGSGRDDRGAHDLGYQHVCSSPSSSLVLPLDANAPSVLSALRPAA